MDITTDHLFSLYEVNRKIKIEELNNRNKERLVLCDEKTVNGIRINLLIQEYYDIYTSLGEGQYASEMLREVRNLKGSYPKATLAQLLQFAKSSTLDKGLFSGNRFAAWINSANEDLVKDMAEYGAWNKVIGYGINPSDVISLTEEEVIQGRNLGETAAAKQPKKDKPKESELTLKWIGEPEELVELYKALTYKNNPLIECPDYKTFEQHFAGKKVTRKIVWLKSVGLLLYLLDNLSDYIDEKLYVRNHAINRTTIRSFIKDNFIHKHGKEYKIIPEETMYTARSRFLRSQENGEANEKNVKNIDTIIQSLNHD